MNMNSNGITQSIVKDFFKMSKIFTGFLVALVVLGTAGQGVAADDKEKKDKSGSTQPTIIREVPGVGKIETEANSVDINKAIEAQTCKEGETDYKKALEDMKSGCSKAGYAVKECQQKSLECLTAEGGNDDIDPIGMVASQMGVPVGNVLSGQACPQLSGKSYATRKDKVEEKLKRAKEQLAEVQKDTAEMNENYQKEMIALNRKMTEAEKEFKEKSKDMDAESRKRMADFQQSQNQAKEELRKIGMNMIQLRAKLTNAQTEKAVALIELTEEAAKIECEARVAAVMSKSSAASTTSSTAMIEKASAIKKRKLGVWRSCLDGFEKKRQAMLEGKRSEQEAIMTEMRNTESRADEIQGMLNLSATQLEEIKQADGTSKNDAQQNLIKLGQEIQQEMTAAYTKLQQTQQAYNTKTANLQTQLNMANMELQKLMSKGEPPEESETSLVQAANTISNSADLIYDIETNPKFASCPFMQSSGGKGKPSGLKSTSEKLKGFRTGEGTR